MIMHRTATKGCIYWRCSQYFTCSARGISEANSDTICMTSDHNHLPDTTSHSKRSRMSTLKTSAGSSLAFPSSVLTSNAQSRLNTEELQSFPSRRALSQTVNRIRRKTVGSVKDTHPSSVSLPEALTKTVRGTDFLLVDSRLAEPTSPVFFAFSSEHGAQLLRTNPHWAIDGESALPALYIFLPDRRMCTYTRALHACFTTDLLMHAKPASFIADFELAMTEAMMNEFPHAELRYCFYHFRRSLFRHISKEGLLPIYGIPVAKELLRCFMSLPFAPVEEVIHAYSEICAALANLIDRGVIATRFRSALNAFTKYVGNTYIGRLTAKSAVAPARFDPPSWNVFERTLSGSPRTNNGVESVHASLNRLFPKANLPLYQCIIRLQKMEDDTHNLQLRHECHPAEHIRGRPKTVCQRQRNIDALVDQYNRTPFEQRDVLKYLRLLQQHLSKASFERVDADLSVAATATHARASHTTTVAPFNDHADAAVLQAHHLTSLAAETTHASATHNSTVAPSNDHSDADVLQGHQLNSMGPYEPAICPSATYDTGGYQPYDLDDHDGVYQPYDHGEEVSEPYDFSAYDNVYFEEYVLI